MKNIKNVYVSYSEIIDKIGENKIKERLHAIHDIYEKFLDETGYKNEEDIYLNDRVLMHSILDYFTDITRLKDFHKIDLINQDKIISYEISWFLRRKPLQVISHNKEELIYINEKFALEILVNHLIKETVDDISKNRVMSSFFDIVIYYFKYRNCDAKVLEFIIASFKAGNSIDKINYD